MANKLFTYKVSYWVHQVCVPRNLFFVSTCNMLIAEPPRLLALANP